jgi:hypothetical protein
MVGIAEEPARQLAPSVGIATAGFCNPGEIHRQLPWSDCIWLTACFRDRHHRRSYAMEVSRPSSRPQHPGHIGKTATSSKSWQQPPYSHRRDFKYRSVASCMYAFVVTKVPVQERNTKSYKFPEENSTEPNQHASSRSHHGGNARQLLQYLLRQSPRVTSRASPDQIDQYTPQVSGSVPINRVHAGLGHVEGRS